jgi:chromate transporter
MKALILYALLLKATVSTFNGLASLPVLRNDLVTHRHLITDKQLDAAVVVNRLTPGPVGLYVVSVGYFADGYPGALAGLMALVTPALFIIPLLRFAGGRAEHPRVKGTIQAVVLASAGMRLGGDCVHCKRSGRRSHFDYRCCGKHDCFTQPQGRKRLGDSFWGIGRINRVMVTPHTKLK